MYNIKNFTINRYIEIINSLNRFFKNKEKLQVWFNYERDAHLASICRTLLIDNCTIEDCSMACLQLELDKLRILFNEVLLAVVNTKIGINARKKYCTINGKQFTAQVVKLLDDCFLKCKGTFVSHFFIHNPNVAPADIPGRIDVRRIAVEYGLEAFHKIAKGDDDFFVFFIAISTIIKERYADFTLPNSSIYRVYVNNLNRMHTVNTINIEDQIEYLCCQFEAKI